MNYASPPLTSTDPLGSDLALDQNGDLLLTPQGDVQIISVGDNVKQMIRVRLQTQPSSYIFGTDLGSRLGETIDDPLNGPTQKLIQQFVYNALLADPRIAQINNINVLDPDDGTMQYFVTVDVTVTGYGNVQTTVPIGGVGGV